PRWQHRTRLSGVRFACPWNSRRLVVFDRSVGGERDCGAGLAHACVDEVEILARGYCLGRGGSPKPSSRLECRVATLPVAGSELAGLESVEHAQRFAHAAPD